MAENCPAERESLSASNARRADIPKTDLVRSNTGGPSLTRPLKRVLLGWLVVIFGVLPLLAQRRTGELRLAIVDPEGAGVTAMVVLASDANQVRQTFSTNALGHYTAAGLPFGTYRLQADAAGFASYSEILQIDSAVPLEHRISLRIAPLETSIVVNEAATLLDPVRTGTIESIGSQALSEQPPSTPGRGVVDLINSQPGWLVEANGVLHPRGSEYDTQYVIDGIPIVDNRSPGFAPQTDVAELQSLRISTADYPAEYGRKLGGVVELSTVQPSLPGLHGKAALQGGSFSTFGGYLSGQTVRGRNTAAISLLSDRTDRFLDPPVAENFTNQASDWAFTSRFERDFDTANRLRVSAERRQVNFLVPNEMVQQQAGQRQDRTSRETMAQASYQHIFNQHSVGMVHGMLRDLAARLWSNPLSTPIAPSQDRGFREAYLDGSISAHFGGHELKAGTEAVITPVREQFAYVITNRRFFGRDVARSFSFSDHKTGDYEALFAQDLMHAGHWTLSAGLRWDRYQLLINDHAFSPRIGVAYYWPAVGMVWRASYDRAFQIPSIENLLLASSQAAQHLTSAATGLPIPASRGDFYQAGFSKSLWGNLRLDANYFVRNIRNFEDDDLLLNTGVSFPTTFHSAAIHGVEAKLEVPHWGRFSGWLSYSNLLGIGRLPVTGGLFLEPDSAQLLHSTDRFPISQDQRNTFRALARAQLSVRLWMAVGGQYGSGLPVNLPDNAGLDDLMNSYGSKILDRVDFARGRVRPSYSMDLSGGVNLWKHESKAVVLQGDVRNLTNQFNVINFASLFSGTALYQPRTFSLRLQTSF